MKHFNLFTKTKVIAIAFFAVLGITSIYAQDPGQKIVGGYDVNIQDHPYQVRLSMGCGGTIINPTWIVTAFHCVEGQSARSISVRAGITRLNQSGGQQVRVKRIVNIAGFRQGDMSLLELERPLDLSTPFAKAIPYAGAIIPLNSDTVGTGWGDTRWQGNQSNTLKAVVMKFSGYANGNTSFMRITGDGKSACNGDSGGPLVAGTKAKYTLVGVVSHGDRCVSPSFYGNVALHAKRIEEITGIKPDSTNPDPNPNPPSSCTDLELQLTLDNYPQETQWEVTNAQGQIVMSGQGYTQGGERIVVKECLPEQCYTFTIKDSYGDGICCSYGEGSYQLAANGKTLASGGSFEAEDQKEICLSSGTYTDITSYTANNTDFRIWPLPVEDVLNVQSPEPIHSLELVTLRGQSVSRVTAQDYMDISGFSKGTYLIIINASDSRIIVKK